MLYEGMLRRQSIGGIYAFTRTAWERIVETKIGFNQF